MPSIISAGTTSGTALNFSGDTTGNLAFTTQAGANTITVANQTGTLNVAGPSFSVYPSVSQSLTSGVATKLQLNTEIFDTNSNFDSTTNYRFTPTVAGYYQINGGMLIAFSTNNGFLTFCSIFKNGTEYNRGSMYYVSAGTSIAQGSSVSAVVFCNGSTDYLELYVRADSSTGTRTTETASSAFNYFSGSFLRGA
jgi:hypothetical protein